MLATKLRGIALIAGIVAVVMAIVSCMPGRLVMHTPAFGWLDPVPSREFSIVSAGGVIGVLHACALFVLAARLWRKPCVDRAWLYVFMAAFLGIADRAIDYVRWFRFSTTLTEAGRLFHGLELMQLAIAVVVLPLALMLASRDNDVPPARALP
ncbi:MAG TPA: hypothetical protein VIV40_01450 [Kofleriaceae bacterium]